MSFGVRLEGKAERKETGSKITQRSGVIERLP